MSNININELTPEQLAQLEQQMREKKAEVTKKLEQDKQTYKEMTEQFVKDFFPVLQNMSESMKS